MVISVKIFAVHSTPISCTDMSLCRSLHSRFFLHLLCQWLLLYPLIVYALKKVSPPTVDPYADPKDDPHNPLRYIASNTLTAISTSLVLVVLLTHSWFMRKWGAKWMLVMLIGEFFFAAGLSTRFYLHSHPDSKNVFIAEYLLVVLSPCGFIAADYVLLGRLARHLGCDEHLLIPFKRITLVFVASDLATFAVQAVGASVAVTSNTTSQLNLGANIFLAGLVLQLASFLVFNLVYAVFIYRVRNFQPKIWEQDRSKPRLQDWRALGIALSISCIGITVRLIYRVAEEAQGFHGYLADSEAFFYGLDTLPLFIAIAVYVPFWPGKYIRPFSGDGMIPLGKPIQPFINGRPSGGDN